MLRVLLPFGLLTGTIAIASLTTPQFLSKPPVSLAQIQLEDDQLGDSNSGAMTQEELVEILRTIAEDVEVNQNQVIFTFNNQSLQMITDSRANRMRIISPIVQIDEISGEDMAKMMLANFHTALDARYAIGSGVVYATFVHPLSTLDATDFQSAVSQVANLTATYGSTYSSGSSLFGAPGPGPDTTDLLPAI